MKLFEDPKMEIMKFAAEDVITTSTGNEDDLPSLTGDCL